MTDSFFFQRRIPSNSSSVLVQCERCYSHRHLSGLLVLISYESQIKIFELCTDFVYVEIVISYCCYNQIGSKSFQKSIVYDSYSHLIVNIFDFQRKLSINLLNFVELFLKFIGRQARVFQMTDSYGFENFLNLLIPKVDKQESKEVGSGHTNKRINHTSATPISSERFTEKKVI